MDGRAVVELARAAVRRLMAAPPTAGAARDALAAIEKFGVGAPYTVAIAGDLAARTALLDSLAGQPLFDPGRRDPARVVMSMRRGEVTALRARHRDGTVEERTLGATASGALIVDDSAILEEVDAAEPATIAVVAAPARRAADRGVEPPPPPWWAVWRWLARWFRAWRARRRGHAEPGLLAARPTRTVDPRRGFVDLLRDLSAQDAVERVFVEVAGGPLPQQIVVLELPSRADPKALAAVGADTCLVACGTRGVVLNEQLEAVLAVVPHVFAVAPSELPEHTDPRVRRLTGYTETAAALTKIAKIERAIAVGRRAAAALRAGRSTLDRFLADAEARFDTRLESLEARRVGDPDAYCTATLDRVRPGVVEHVRRSIARAVARVEADLERLGAEWSARLDETTSADTLRAAAARLDDESLAALQAAQAATRRELIDDVTVRTQALYDDLVADLWSDSSTAEPPPAWLTVDVQITELATGLKLGTVASRLTSLFRSFDSRKTDARARLAERLAKLREVAAASFVDAEPQLEPAISEALARALRAEVGRQTTVLDAELAATGTERARLASYAAIRDAARDEAAVIVQAVETLERELP